jgi:hypothetical protein
MVNIIIGALVWQAIVTLFVLLGKERYATVVGCGVWYIVISLGVTIVNFFKKG